MINFREKTLILLPHIDDEFAMAPIIKEFTTINSKNIKVLFCAERLTNDILLRVIRRKESVKSLSLLGCSKDSIDYLNNYFLINDKKLHESASKIYFYMKSLRNTYNFTQIFT